MQWDHSRKLNCNETDCGMTENALEMNSEANCVCIYSSIMKHTLSICYLSSMAKLPTPWHEVPI